MAKAGQMEAALDRDARSKGESKHVRPERAFQTVDRLAQRRQENGTIAEALNGQTFAGKIRPETAALVRRSTGRRSRSRSGLSGEPDRV